MTKIIKKFIGNVIDKGICIEESVSFDQYLFFCVEEMMLVHLHDWIASHYGQLEGELEQFYLASFFCCVLRIY